MKQDRRNAETIPILSPASVGEICEKAESPRDACLVALLYMSGRRIGEVLGLRKTDFLRVGNIMYFTTFNEKSWRKKKTGDFQVEKHVQFKDYDGIVYYEKITPKFSLTSPSGKKLGHYVVDYLDSLEDNGYLFPAFKRVRHVSRPHIGRVRAYQIVRSLDERLWLHAFRHINFTRMATVYRDDPMSMHRLTFHKQFKSTEGYIHKKETEERLEKM